MQTGKSDNIGNYSQLSNLLNSSSKHPFSDIFEEVGFQGHAALVVDSLDILAEVVAGSEGKGCVISHMQFICRIINDLITSLE